MRVLMLNRPTAFIAPGGDVMQMESTRRYLQKLGHVVDVSLAARPDVLKYDIVHVFNMQSGTMPHSFYQISHARHQGKPVVLSTIYWTHEELNAGAGDEVLVQSQSSWKRLRTLARNHPRELPVLAHYAWEKFRNRAQSSEQQRACLEMADALLPNTRAEKELLMRDFGAPEEKFRVIPNAANSRFYCADAAPFVEKFGLRDFVLCVARVEPRKNQLRLLEVLRELDLPAVFIGKMERSSPYVQACLKFAGPKVLFIDHLPHEQLAPAYAAAKVHALVSWYETPGISSLEAGLAGANIVSTARGGTREYFEKYAFYCEPDDTSSIRRAVRDAFATEKSPQLQEHIKANFTWERVAELTSKIYEEVSEAGKVK
jgi:glycosyltransferase involved in cell wall biosynthesis